MQRLISWTRGHPGWLALGAVFLASLLAVSMGGFLPSGKKPQTREFVIEASKFSYSPERIKVNKGDHVILHLRPLDVSHGLYVDGYDLQTHAAPGEEATLDFVADRAGTFRFRCSRTCGPLHPFMIGQMEVAPNSPFIGSVVVALAAAVGALGIGWWVRPKP